jgi:hypothetical protein
MNKYEEKIEVIEKANSELLASVNDIREENASLKIKVNDVETNETKRSKKEQVHEKQMLIRDLFIKVRQRISAEIKGQHLGKNQIDILFDKDIDSIKLSNEHPL